MDLPMNQDKLKNLIASIPTEQLKSEEIEPFIQQMHKHLIEQALQGEMDTHLGHDRYKRHSGTNSRNGSSKKRLKTEKGAIAISVPRDRDGSFHRLFLRDKHERERLMIKSSPFTAKG